MIIHCSNCGQVIEKSRDGKIDFSMINSQNSTPIICKCGAEGFVSFMQPHDNLIITMQLFKKAIK